MGRGFLIGGLTMLALATTGQSAGAATWANGRTTPTLREVVAIDATGETSWIYGQEDVAGDGLASFKPQEQSIDVRTGYAATDASTFWVRAYASEQTAVGGNVTVFVFIDADANAGTGGRASAPEINPLLTTDPTPGGYEFCVGMRGNGAVDGIWAYRAAQSRWDALPPNLGSRVGESGSDIDPIRIGVDAHGYVQARIDLATINLTQACGATLFFRSANTAAGLGSGDLDVGRAGSCIPADANGDRIPDVLVPPTGCTTDAQCPERGVCQNGQCIIAPPCGTDADCPSGLVCTADGRCVPQGGSACTSDEQCNGLLCLNGVCTACTPGGTECGPDRRCAPDGRCVSGAPTGGSSGGVEGDGGIALAPDEKVVGGAFNCSAGGAGAAEFSLAGWLAVALGGWIQRRTKRKVTRS